MVASSISRHTSFASPREFSRRTGRQSSITHGAAPRSLHHESPPRSVGHEVARPPTLGQSALRSQTDANASEVELRERNSMPTKLGHVEQARALRLRSRRLLGGPPGHAPTSSYVETFWLPVLGPSTTWLIRLLNNHLDQKGEDVEISLADLGWALGLGERPGRHSPLLRALGRAADFDLVLRAMPPADLTCTEPTSDPTLLSVLVRRALPSLPPRLIERLPARLAREHHEFTIESTVRVLRLNASPERSANLARSTHSNHPATAS